MSGHPDLVAPWLEALEARHLADLTFPEVRRAVQALSSLWVERRGRIGRGAALDGAGKRAAFALYFAPLHFLLLREVVHALGAASPEPQAIADLGCGTGPAGAAWALEAQGRPTLFGIDRSPWAIAEARWNWSRLGLTGTARVGDLARGAGSADSIVAAFAVNELDAGPRERLLVRLRAEADKGARVLVVEPLARSATRWWDSWVQAFERGGGRADEWRFRLDLPPLLERFDRAAGLSHRETGVRSLYTVGRFPAGSEPAGQEE